MSTSGTPLLDAVGAAIRDYQRPEERPEVAALIPAAVAALATERLNLVAKRDRGYSLISRLGTGEPLRYQGESVAAAYAAQKKRNDATWAEIAAVKASETVCELTPERAARLRAHVLDGLPRALEYRAAAEIVANIEADMTDEPAESPTLKRLKEWTESRMEDLSDKLSYALAADQVALIKALTGKPAPFRRRWDVLTGKGASTRILEVPIKAPYIRLTFRDILARVKTQTSVRDLFGCWGLEAKVRKDKQADGVTRTVIYADGWEVTAL